jgi:hypothetical protein
MTTLLLIILLALLLAAFLGGPRYYRGRGRRTIIQRDID